MVVAAAPPSAPAAPPASRHGRSGSKQSTHPPQPNGKSAQPTRSGTAHGRSASGGTAHQPAASQHSVTSSRTSLQRREVALLTLHPPSSPASGVAAEWLDGLLMLLQQPPITAETSRLLGIISRWGLKIRLLNVRYDEGDVEGEAKGPGKVVVPSRDGVDEDYYYDVFAG